jgi:hypothetical protein
MFKLLCTSPYPKSAFDGMHMALIFVVRLIMHILSLAISSSLSLYVHIKQPQNPTAPWGLRHGFICNRNDMGIRLIATQIESFPSWGHLHNMVNFCRPFLTNPWTHNIKEINGPLRQRHVWVIKEILIWRRTRCADTRMQYQPMQHDVGRPPARKVKPHVHVCWCAKRCSQIKREVKPNIVQYQ